jgi:hypothetical protein
MEDDTKEFLKMMPFFARLSMIGVCTLLSPLNPKGCD